MSNIFGLEQEEVDEVRIWANKTIAGEIGQEESWEEAQRAARIVLQVTESERRSLGEMTEEECEELVGTWVDIKFNGVVEPQLLVQGAPQPGALSRNGQKGTSSLFDAFPRPDLKRVFSREMEPEPVAKTAPDHEPRYDTSKEYEDMDSDIWKHDRQHWRSAGASYAHRDLPDDYGPYREVRPESLTLGELRRAGKAAEFAPNKDRQYLDRDGDTWEWDSAQWVCPAWNLKKDELFDTYGPYTEIEEGPNKAKKYKDREGDVWHWTGDNWRCGDMPIYDRQLPRAFEPYTEVKEDDDA